ncbi:MAG: hypothetical protein AAF937_03595 [Planctomycetota bacterium]
MSFADFDESLGTGQPGDEGGVFTPALAKIQAGGEDAAAVPVAHRSATKQYMLVGGVVAAGIGVLIFLRMQGVGAGLASAGDEVNIEYPIDAPTNVNTERRQRDVLDALAMSGEIAQVPSEQIQQNPFELEPITTTEEQRLAAEEQVEEVPQGPTPEELRLAELDEIAATLELGTVISGRISLARINGKTYRIGDTVAGEFRVTAINPDRTVEIKADETTYVLEMTSR